MLRHHLLTIVRHLWKRRQYSIISLTSLTLGLSIFCLTTLHVRNELSFNRHWPDSGLVYRLTSKRSGTNADQPRSSYFTAAPLTSIRDYLDGLISDYLEIVIISTDVTSFEQPPLTLAVTDSAFQGIFPVTVTAGSLDRVLNGSGSIALESGRAIRMFGSVDAALGSRLTLEGQRFFSTSPTFVSPQPSEFEVAAIYTLPDPVTDSTRFDGILPDTPHSSRLFPHVDGERVSNINVWLKLAEGIEAEQVNEQLALYLNDSVLPNRESAATDGPGQSQPVDFRVQALEDIYFGEIPENPSGNIKRLLTFSLLALLVLMAGCSNVISLALAAAMERRREIGIRKSVGAVQRNIVLQSLGESVLLSLLALLPVSALVSLLHEPFANLLSITSMPPPGIPEYLIMLSIVLLVGVVNGLYPALVLSRVKPVTALKTQAAQPGIRKLNLRTLLVGLQFCFSIVLLVVTSGLYLQLWVTRHQPLGFNMENLATASVRFQLLQTRSDIGDVMLNELERIPGITAATNPIAIPNASRATPPAAYQLVNTRQELSGIEAQKLGSKPGLFDVIETPMLAGRDLNIELDRLPPYDPGTEPPPTENVIINRVALDALGFDEPEQALGQRLYSIFDYGSGPVHTPIEIIGVVENSMLSTIFQRPGPEFYAFQPFSPPRVLFRYDAAADADIARRVEQVLLDVAGENGEVEFLEDTLRRGLEQEARESRLLLICAGLALCLSCIGLYGLVSVALRTQVKEIGMRKVLGATTSGVIATFLRRFSIPVMLANLVAWPPAVYFVLRWIQQFPYQLDKGWLLPVCLGTTALVSLIAWFTVGALTWHAASIRPVRSLRYE